MSSLCFAGTPTWVENQIQQELMKMYPGSDVELVQPIRWIRGEAPSQAASLTVLGEDAKGNLQFHIVTSQSSADGWATFRAWKKIPIASHRIMVGEGLKTDYFKFERLDLASGLAHEYHTLMIDPESDLSRFEAIQTIPQGQFILKNTVQRIPDVRKGDAVRVQVISGDLTLTTQGIAQEMGYLSQRLRIYMPRGKRELVGLLQSGIVVEVRL